MEYDKKLIIFGNHENYPRNPLGHVEYTQRNLLPPIDGIPDTSRTRNLASIVAVSDKFIDLVLEKVHSLSSWDICILTDQPERFSGFFYVEKYEKAVFSLGDKITFSLRMSMKFKSGVTQIDADEIENLKQDFIEDKHIYENFKCMGKSIICDNMLDILLGRCLYPHIEILNLDSDERMYVIDEKVYYMPYTEKLPDIIYHNELIKPGVDHSSIWAGGRRQIMGEGEGASLAISLFRAGVKVDLYEVSPFIGGDSCHYMDWD
jgi:hypothetical protein